MLVFSLGQKEWGYPFGKPPNCQNYYFSWNLLVELQNYLSIIYNIIFFWIFFSLFS